MSAAPSLRSLAVCADTRGEALAAVARGASGDEGLRRAVERYTGAREGGPLGGGEAAEIAGRALLLRGLRCEPGRRISAARVQEGALAIAREGRPLLLACADLLVELSGRWEEPRAPRAGLALHALAPICERIGATALQRELEDLAFRCLDRASYDEVARAVSMRRAERDLLVSDLIERVREALGEAQIEAEVTGRAKHFWSIQKKLAGKGGPAALHDLFGLRVVAPDEACCYAAVSALHERFSPVVGRFKDYIARPKESGYRSLHTTVQVDEGLVVEIQARTAAMHRQAEQGEAAHWRYKSPASGPPDDARWVYALTPRGDVIRLPRGATSLDFAYAIHSDLGRRFAGAIVDGKAAQGERPLQTGQVVRVLTSGHASPTPGQLERTRTHQARNRIRAALGGTKGLTRVI